MTDCYEESHRQNGDNAKFQSTNNKTELINYLVALLLIFLCSLCMDTNLANTSQILWFENANPLSNQFEFLGSGTPAIFGVLCMMDWIFLCYSAGSFLAQAAKPNPLW